MNESLEITSATGPGGVRIVRVTGRLDSRGTPQFVRECGLESGPGTSMVLNLSGVTFLSSSGVGALLALSERARESGHHVRLASPAPVVQATLNLLNLGEYLTICASEDEALRKAA